MYNFDLSYALPRRSASWIINLVADCPFCKEWVDLTDEPDFWYDHNLRPGRKGEAVEVNCPECGATFLIDIK